MSGPLPAGGSGPPMTLRSLLWLVAFLQNAAPFQVTVRDDNCIVVSLEESDVASSSSEYVVKITGESKNYFFQFEEFNSTLPSPVVFNASYHGLYYIVTLMVVNSNMVSKPVRSITVLTKPLPVSSVSIYDYKSSPETGVLFEIQYPEKYNVFTRVNISYWEGKDYRTMLYKDFFKGKTVFNHWLPGICYSNITFQLVSEATFNKSTLVEYSGVRHEPKQHRTVPYPPRNISVQIVHMSKNDWEENSGNFAEESFMGPQDVIGKEKLTHFSNDPTEIPSANPSYTWPDHHYNSTDYKTTSQPDWWTNEAESPENEDEFVNAVPSEYENNSATMSGKLTPEPPSFLPMQMVLSWLPPKPPTAFDGFHINIEREENATEFLTVSEDTHEFVAELKEPGKYKLSVTTFSSSGSCEIRRSQAAKTLNFYITPVSPEITSVDYFNNLLYVSWMYGDVGTDLSHSRMLHWMVIAEGKKKIKKSVTRNVMTAVLSLPPGDIYNLSVTACTERGSNTSTPQLVKLEPAPPKSLFAVNKTQTSVTLLWVEEGVADFFEVFCQQAGSGSETKLQEAVTVSSHVVTISNLLPATPYNCSVTTFSHNSPSIPTFIAVSTMVTEMNPNIVVISVLAILSILLIGLLLVTLMVLRRKHLQMARECGAGTFVNFASLERDGKLPYNWRRSVFAFLTLLPSCLWTDYLLAFYINPWSKNGLKKRKLTNPVQLDDFDGYIKDMAKDSDYKFSLQFEELKLIGLDIPHSAAALPMNRCKNRYTNVLPYDFSRVRLVSMNEEEGSDYINANYIPGYNSPQEYIATQGPLPETRNDFWKMVLQQKSQIIVMLTQCNEKRRVKCDHYWPFTEEPIAYGDITVEMLSEEEQTDWSYRNFRISYADEVQDVMHFNYTAWPDHGVPTTNAAESILQFVQMVRQQSTKSKGPMVIHCSAGVGRTGTFIALDRLSQHIRDHEFVDILGLVSDMRSYRMSMVQTEEQYIFIHQCVQLMWLKKKQQFCISDVIYENVSKS
ncbi:receptor-type tyrosine-protein phosphatase O isoform X4 [Emydura macquarii macquarii]|uniref:receptor-type tyrosine-protein phosphatase O isoform X4 n=1 Tax=Emydura macquarii macquarii TaxID=1129001 RepID=UPI00352B420C